jgi:hypothetical protein
MLDRDIPSDIAIPDNNEAPTLNLPKNVKVIIACSQLYNFIDRERGAVSADQTSSRYIRSARLRGFDKLLAFMCADRHARCLEITSNGCVVEETCKDAKLPDNFHSNLENFMEDLSIANNVQVINKSEQEENMCAFRSLLSILMKCAGLPDLVDPHRHARQLQLFAVFAVCKAGELAGVLSSLREAIQKVITGWDTTEEEWARSLQASTASQPTSGEAAASVTAAAVAAASQPTSEVAEKEATNPSVEIAADPAVAPATGPADGSAGIQEESAPYLTMSRTQIRYKQGVENGVYNKHAHAKVTLCGKTEEHIGKRTLEIHEILGNIELLNRLPEPFSTRLKLIWKYGSGHAKGHDKDAKNFRNLLAKFVMYEASDDLGNRLEDVQTLCIPTRRRGASEPTWREKFAFTISNPVSYYDSFLVDVLKEFLPPVKVLCLISDDKSESLTFFDNEMMNILPLSSETQLPIAMHFINTTMAAMTSKDKKFSSSGENHYEPLLGIDWTELLKNGSFNYEVCRLRCN